MRKLKFDNYKIELKKDKIPNSNYCMFGSLFLNGAKLPEAGTTFKEDVTDRELLEWAFYMIDKQNDNLGL